MTKKTSSALSKHAGTAHNLMGHHNASGLSKSDAQTLKGHVAKTLHGSVAYVPGFLNNNPNSMADPDAAQDQAEKQSGVDTDNDNDAGTGH